MMQEPSFTCDECLRTIDCARQDVVCVQINRPICDTRDTRDEPNRHFCNLKCLMVWVTKRLSC